MRNSLTDPQLQTKISWTHGIYSGETLDKFLSEPPSHIDWAWAPQRSRTMKGTPMKITDGQDPYRCGFQKKNILPAGGRLHRVNAQLCYSPVYLARNFFWTFG